MKLNAEEVVEASTGDASITASVYNPLRFPNSAPDKMIQVAIIQILNVQIPIIRRTTINTDNSAYRDLVAPNFTFSLGDMK